MADETTTPEQSPDQTTDQPTQPDQPAPPPPTAPCPPQGQQQQQAYAGFSMLYPGLPQQIAPTMPQPFGNYSMLIPLFPFGYQGPGGPATLTMQTVPPPPQTTMPYPPLEMHHVIPFTSPPPMLANQQQQQMQMQQPQLMPQFLNYSMLFPNTTPPPQMAPPQTLVFPGQPQQLQQQPFGNYSMLIPLFPYGYQGQGAQQAQQQVGGAAPGLNPQMFVPQMMMMMQTMPIMMMPPMIMPGAQAQQVTPPVTFLPTYFPTLVYPRPW